MSITDSLWVDDLKPFVAADLVADELIGEVLAYQKRVDVDKSKSMALSLAIQGIVRAAERFDIEGIDLLIGIEHAVASVIVSHWDGDKDRRRAFTAIGEGIVNNIAGMS